MRMGKRFVKNVRTEGTVMSWGQLRVHPVQKGRYLPIGQTIILESHQCPLCHEGYFADSLAQTECECVQKDNTATTKEQPLAIIVHLGLIQDMWPRIDLCLFFMHRSEEGPLLEQ